jgi:protein LTV1
MEKAARAAAPSPEPTPAPEDDDDDSGSETEREEDYRTTVSRPKGETAADRKARKAAVKADRSVCPLNPSSYHPC